MAELTVAVVTTDTDGNKSIKTQTARRAKVFSIIENAMADGHAVLVAETEETVSSLADELSLDETPKVEMPEQPLAVASVGASMATAATAATASTASKAKASADPDGSLVLNAAPLTPVDPDTEAPLGTNDPAGQDPIFEQVN